METLGNVGRSFRFDLDAYKKSILASSGYRERVEFTVRYLSDQLLLTEDEIKSLALEERLGVIPVRLVFDLAVRCMSYEFGGKYHISYTEVDIRDVARAIEDLEYHRVPKEKMTPIHHEYIALWAGKLENIFGEVKTMKRQFQPEAYQAPSKPIMEKPVPQEQRKAPPLQEEMDRLFKDFR